MQFDDPESERDYWKARCYSLEKQLADSPAKDRQRRLDMFAASALQGLLIAWRGEAIPSGWTPKEYYAFHARTYAEAQISELDESGKDEAEKRDAAKGSADA